MATVIDPTAIVKPGAVIGNDCKIGPYCIIGPNVVLGDRVELVSNVVIDGKTSIGDDSIVYPFAVLGVMGQDLKWQDESAMTGLRIGKRCKIREHVTIHSGTPASDGTEIGDNCQIMINARVGHDCKIGNGVVMSKLVQVAGHVEIEDFAVLSGGVMVLQFVRIGRNAFIAGKSGVIDDVVPYSIYEAAGRRQALYYEAASRQALYRTVNLAGLRHYMVTDDEIQAIYKVYNSVFGCDADNTSLTDKLNKVRKEVKNNKYAMDAIDFIENRSKLGIRTEKWSDNSSSKGLKRPGICTSLILDGIASEDLNMFYERIYNSVCSISSINYIEFAGHNR